MDEQQEKPKDNHDDDRPEAGFDLDLSLRNPHFRAWGGAKQLESLMPVIKWGLAALAAGLGLMELSGFFK